MKTTQKNIRMYALLLIMSSSLLSIAQTHKIDISNSTIIWTAEKVTGSHTGSISLSSGNLTFTAEKITAGTFTITMNSITCTDITDKATNAQLVGHLKSDDFFGTATFPEAFFTITRVDYTTNNTGKIVGNLTIKGITHAIEFPFTKTGNNYIAKATVDRTKFNIRYGSGSFFDNLGDSVIYDNFTLQINIRII